MAQLTLQEIKQLAERMWEGCDGCDETDKQMWINGFITGALSNQIELPSNEDIEKEFDTHNEKYYIFTEGAKWMKEQILNQNK